MRLAHLPVCLLALSLASGCSTTPSQTGNPFDEPVRSRAEADQGSQQFVQPPIPRVDQTAVVSVGTDPAPAVETESDVLVFAAGAAPMSVVSVPVDVEIESSETSVSPLGSAEGSVADEVLQEGRRLGRLGDAAGQIQLLEQAGAMGSADAFYDLAKVYLTGAGVDKAPDVAVGYLNQAVSLGHVEAIRVLGWLYVMGSAVDKDIPYGETLLERAAEQSVRAQREYGMALANLRHPHLNNIERGLDYLRAAAAAGDEEAATAYATAFSSGPVKPTPSSTGSRGSTQGGAATLENSAADGEASLEERGRAGDVDAMYQYALNVSLGRIRVQGDPQFTAYCWYSVAAARGYSPALAEVQSLAGVRKLADRSAPGQMDACIAELNSEINGG
ncbi:hypothetical protein [Pseudomonas guariconensis]|uniref:hypothetical protein n=1 Tax=Pseudomonas guariconensis TaxID=1288410 RepID=UPI003906B6B8